MVAPLDWGLGHTTRCIPLIQHILLSGHGVIFAGNERQRNYISETFPGLPSIHLDGYDVRYSRNRSMFMFSLFRQIPRLMQVIRKEQYWLQQAVKKHNVDAIISDNRYGLFHHSVPSVIITHQLQVVTGMGQAADILLRRMHYRYLQRFGQCWVADVPEAPGLSGKLAHPVSLPVNSTYIGLLSQHEQKETENKHLLILLSGPEPQRTILHEHLWQQVLQYNGKVVFIAGSTAAPDPAHIPAHIAYYNRLAKQELADELNGAHMVICRSGYSTIMDLVKLQKKAVLIPTPGQTEQEYLALQLQQRGIFPFIRQKDFDLSTILSSAQDFPYCHPFDADSFYRYQQVLDDWL